MPVATRNGRMALMSLCQPWQPALPVPDGTISQGDRQHFMWGYPDILWAAAAVPSVGYVTVSDAARYGLAVSDAARYGIAVEDALASGLSIEDL